jgi:hypothetical protein
MYYTSHLNMWIIVQNEDSKVGYGELSISGIVSTLQPFG